MVVASFYKSRTKKSQFSSKSGKSGMSRTSTKKSKAKTKAKMTSTKVKAIVSREINKELETKLRPLATVYAGVPLNVNQTINTVFYNNYCLGSPAVTWLGPTNQPNFVGVQGMSFPQGTGSNERIGKYMNLKHTSLQFRVGLVGVPRQVSQTRFRLIVYKAKRNAALGTSGGNPNETLFLSQDGNPVGINNIYTSANQAYELMNRVVNKRNFEVSMDTQFVLGHPTLSVAGSTSIVTSTCQSLPDEKNFLLKLDHKNEHTAFGAGNEPSDLRYQYCITILSCPTGNLEATGHNNWRTYVRGVTSAKDA